MAKTGTSVETLQAAPLRVLFIEDSSADIELCVQGLKKAGFALDYDVVETLEAFAERVRSNSYDLILADYNLNGWYGPEALPLLRSLGKDIPFIVVTGTLGDETAVECIKQGATDYVRKDRLVQLPVAVRRALQEEVVRAQRAEAVEALRESEASFRLLFANNPLPMWVYDRETLHFTEVNQAAIEHYGYTRDEFLRMRLTDLRPPEDIPRLLEQLAQRPAGLQTGIQSRHRLKNGQIIDVEITSHPVEIAGRKGMLVVPQDVTERKRAEQENLRLITAIEQAAEAIVITDAAGRIQYVNPAFTSVTGYDRSEALGQNPRMLQSGRHDAQFYQKLWQTILAGHVWRGEMINRRKDGTFYAEESTIAPVMDGDRAITHFIAIKQDITERKQTQEMLAASEHRLRTIVEAEPECVTILACDGAVEHINPAGLAMLEAASAEDILGRKLEDRIAAEFRKRFRSLLQLAAQGDGGEMVFVLEGLRGTERWLETHQVPLRDQQGQVTAILGITRDITERRMVQELLLASEERYRLLFERNLAGVYRGILGERLLDCNEAFARIFGYASRQQLLEHPFADADWKDSQGGRYVTRLTAEGSLTNTELSAKRNDGAEVFILANATLLEAERGGPRLVEGTLLDITERKRAEETLRKSEEKHRGLFEHATYGICRLTREGKVLDVNPALVAMLGYSSKEELLGVNLAERVYQDSDERIALMSQWKNQDRIQGAEMVWRRKNGRPMQVRLSGRKTRDELSGEDCLEEIVEDVTEHRALEAQFRQAQKFEAIGHLAGGVAHDFNNMIGAIVGWADLGLGEVPGASVLHAYLTRIRQQADRAAALTRQLLAFARRQRLEARNINVNETVTEALNLLAKLLGSDIDVETKLAPDLAPVWADPTQIEQVLTNLCLNSRDAMPRGGRLLIETENVFIDDEYCRYHTYAQPGHYVRLAVSDTGEGMDPATLERLFEPFFTTKGPGKGTGLGLATVYGIVKQHGGFIYVYSEPSFGTAFRIYLPAAAGKTEKIEKTDIPPPRGGTETILLAEDHEDLREMACETLERLGYQVLRATDGEEALKVFREHDERIALVLLDVVLPKLSGPGAYSQMRALRPELPALFVTGYSAESAQLSALQQQGLGVLQKPYSPANLARKIRETLDKKEASQAQDPPAT